MWGPNFLSWLLMRSQMVLLIPQNTPFTNAIFNINNLLMVLFRYQTTPCHGDQFVNQEPNWKSGTWERWLEYVTEQYSECFLLF